MAVPPVAGIAVDGLGGLGDPAFPSLGGAVEAAPSAREGGFLAQLVSALDRLSDVQREAAAQSQALASGRAQDLTEVVLAVERASLALQLAVQVRNRAVEAYQDLFRMQI
jgi:flagellar hook-basal body complex protein FliE